MSARNKQVNSHDLVNDDSGDPDVLDSLRTNLPHMVVVPGVVAAAASSTAATFAYLAAAILNALATVTSTVTGGWLEWEVTLAPGTYKLRTFYQKDANAGILKVLVDGVQVDTFDAYAAAPALNQVDETADVVLSGGTHTVRYYSNTKHASSSAYAILLHGFALTRTGD